MKLLILIVLFFGLNFKALAKNLTDASSPSAFMQEASLQEKQAFVDQWNKWVDEQELSVKEKLALRALVTPSSEISGPDVLENVEPSILSWYYGLEDQESDLLHEVARISSKTDTNTCLQYTLCVIVTKSSQSLTAYQNSQPISGLTGVPVSTARRGRSTPTGIFSVGELAGRGRKSGKYRGATLGYAMQIHGDYFLHATSKDNYSQLGSRASAGCVRMTFPKAERLNRMMKQLGRSQVRVVVRH